MNHAYFYRPSKIPAELLANFTHVIGQSYDGNLGLRLLKQNIAQLTGYRKPQVEGPSQLIKGTAAYTTADYQAWSNPDYNVGGTWRDGATFTLKEFVDKYHKNESFFLHAANGDRLRSYDKGRYFYLLRPNAGAKQWWSDVAAVHKRETHWQGVFVDNVGIDDDKLDEVLKEMQLSGPVQEYAGADVSKQYQQEWCEFLDVGRLTMPQGTILGANLIGDWFAQQNTDELIKRLDLIMLEAFAPWLNMRSNFKPEHSLNILKRAQQIADAGKHLICVCHLSSKDTPARAAYEYARYCLIAGDKTSVRLVVDGSYSGAPVLIPEMGLDLGKPLGAAVLQGRSWYRDFEHYRVDVFPETMTANFIKVDRTPQPEPVDPIVQLQQQVAAVLEREQIKDKLIEALQGKIDAQAKTVSELQTRLAQPIQVTGTVKI